MKKALFFPSLLLSFYAVPSQAADMSCVAAWERDHSMNYQKCVAPEKKQAHAKAEYSSCIGKWERDHSVNYQGCEAAQSLVNNGYKNTVALVQNPM